MDILHHSECHCIIFFLVCSYRFHEEIYFFYKKDNKLLVPFGFFVFVSNIAYWIAKDLLHGYELGYFEGKFEWISSIQVAYYRFPENFNNQPIWFLVSLFDAYMFYMFINYLSKNKKLWVRWGAVVWCRLVWIYNTSNTCLQATILYRTCYVRHAIHIYWGIFATEYEIVNS